MSSVPTPSAAPGAEVSVGGRTARRQRHAAGALLRLALIREGKPPPELTGRLLARTTDTTLLGLARYHGVGGWLYEAVVDRGDVSAVLMAGLEEEHSAAVQGHLHGLWQLTRIATTLHAADVRWVVVKGPVLVDLLHGPLGRRHYKDLDVLVHPAEFRVAIAALEADGGALLDRNWPLLRRDQRAQVHVATPSGLDLDLHWDLVNTNRRRMAIDTDAILGRRETVDLGGLSVPTLDPTDSLIHLAVHAAVSGGDKLLWIKDIERSAARRPPDWDALVERARAWHVAGSVGLMLDRAMRVLRADVPADVPRALLGRRLRDLVELLDRVEPLETSKGGPTPGRTVARAIGHGAVGGTVVMAKRFQRHFDPREPARSSPFTPAGTDADREAYLDGVVSDGARG